MFDVDKTSLSENIIVLGKRKAAQNMNDSELKLRKKIGSNTKQNK